MFDLLKKFDENVIAFSRRLNEPFARFAIFLVYFWFGVLKVFDLSPANPLVAELLEKTLPFVTFDQFIVVFGIYEMVIGILFLVPRLSRVALVLLVPHLVTTVMPLILLPQVAWQGFFIPTMEGQYMLKNILIIALALVIASRMEHWEGKKV